MNFDGCVGQIQIKFRHGKINSVSCTINTVDKKNNREKLILKDIHTHMPNYPHSTGCKIRIIEKVLFLTSLVSTFPSNTLRFLLIND